MCKNIRDIKLIDEEISLLSNALKEKMKFHTEQLEFLITTKSKDSARQEEKVKIVELYKLIAKING